MALAPDGAALSQQDAAAASLAAYGYTGTPPFSLAGTSGWARVVDVVDGDSLAVVTRVFGEAAEPSRLSIRLSGVDAWELSATDPAQRAAALRARARLLELITGATHEEAQAADTRPEIRALLSRAVHLVWLKCEGFDKYGRTLAAVSLGGPMAACVSATLLEEGLVVPYSGAGPRAGDCTPLLWS